MKNQSLGKLFLDELEDVYNAELQIEESLPKLIKLASLPDLRDALTNHLRETKNQITRIERIFKILDHKAEEKNSESMEGLIHEGDEMLEKKEKSPLLDAAIIAGAQKIEHYEIASYGTLKSFAKHLNLDKEIINLIKESLDEESAADKKLTHIAEGSFFSSGVNEEAANTTMEVTSK